MAKQKPYFKMCVELKFPPEAPLGQTQRSLSPCLLPGGRGAKATTGPWRSGLDWLSAVETEDAGEAPSAAERQEVRITL